MRQYLCCLFRCLLVILFTLAMTGEPCAFPLYWESDYGTLTDNAHVDDDTYDVKPLGFNFPFYESLYTEIGIGSNGVLAFSVSDGTTCEWDHKWNWKNTGKPGTTPVIAPLWTDWDAYYGNIYYRNAGTPGNRRFIVTYEFTEHYWQEDASAIFQVILFENGTIQFGWADVSYTEVDSDGERVLSGVSNGAGKVTSLGEGTAFNEGTLGNQNRWFVYDGAMSRYQMTEKKPNDPPFTPTLKNPVHGAWVGTLTPQLELNPSVDPDGDSISYRFEVYKDQALTMLVSQGVSLTPGWTTPASQLYNHKWYYWRAQAEDEHGAKSGWMEISSFFTNKPCVFPLYWESDYGTLTDNAHLGDDTYDVKSLGFDFPFYGSLYTEIGIGSNGVLAFRVSDGTMCEWDHKWNWRNTEDTGNTGNPGNAPVIAPLWTDWDSSYGNIYYRSAGTPGNRRFIVTYEFTKHYWQEDASAIFQVILFENGNIQFGWADVSYTEVDSDGERSLTGVSDGTGKVTSLGEGTAFNEGTLGNQNRWFVYDGAMSRYLMMEEKPNDPPSTPTLKNPGHGAWMETLTPQLELNPSLDPDGDSISYRFEVYDDSSLITPICQEVSLTPDWTTPASIPASRLNNHTWYFWRAQAEDEHGAKSNWMETSSFFTNDTVVDDPPNINIIEPSVDLSVDLSLSSVLIQWDDHDPDSNADIALFYDQDNSGLDGTLIAAGLKEDPDGESDSYLWDIATLPAGIYYVYAIIADAHSSNASYSQGAIIVGTGLLQADFTADTTNGVWPLTVNFTDNSVGTITSWLWDFGDQETSSEQNPTHIYQRAGAYAVSLEVTNPGGSSDTRTKKDYILIAEQGPSAVPGDLDFDLDVDAADFKIFLNTFGRHEWENGYCGGADYDGDHWITFIDYQIWYGYYFDKL